MNDCIEQLKTQQDLPDGMLLDLLRTDSFDDALFAAADAVRQRVYGKAVFVRGLIELTNYCKNDC
ncbi:MAG: [Clostridia bacterium]|nr:[FeFe] hydrogenase H-cluster radical SAM maturase HydE [Clostridia bacterium]